MSDLIWMLNKLTSESGEIQVPGIMSDVCPLSLEETYLYEKCEFDLNEFREETGVYEIRHPADKVRTLPLTLV